MRSANHRLWVEGTQVCNLTGTSGERYGDTGLWCAIIAVTTNDATAAGKAIAKLRSVPASASDNTRREDHIEHVLMRDLLDRWMSAGDKSAVDATLTSWAQAALNDQRSGDSDLVTGTACGVRLHDLYFGTSYRMQGQIPSGLASLAGYVQMSAGGEWIESSQYNPGTVVLLAMCNMAHRTATGSDIVPGTSQFLADAGRIAAQQITPDFGQALQWGDEENPRDFLGRLYRRATQLSASPSPEAQWTLDQLLTRHWRFSSAQFMARALLLAQPGVTPSPVGPRALTAGLGTIYERDGAALSFASALRNTNVDHTLDFPSFDVQVWRDGEWALTHPIGYGAPDELTVNGPVYAGHAAFRQRAPTWVTSGNGWSAIAGTVDGGHVYDDWPNTSDHIQYAGRVTVLAHEPSYSVVIVRDSVVMSDPRSAANWPASWRNTAQYPQQQTIQAFDGKFWALWHMKAQPSTSGNVVSWNTPGGRSARLHHFAASGVQVAVVNEATLGWSGLRSTEIGWQVRLHTAAPVLWQVFVTGSNLPSVSVSGNTVTVGSQRWTITSTGVTGP